MDQTYSLFTHRHNFAAWAAGRASQRGFASVSILKAALEASEIALEIQDPSGWPASAEQFDAFHSRYCNKIADYLRRAGLANVFYGRAAKLLAVYIKSMVIVSDRSGSTFSDIVHPPVDRTLLQNLAQDPQFSRQLRAYWRSVSWTRLSESEYFALIAGFRQSGLDKPAFWMIERYWDPTGDSDS
jgi:hypothetical protein